MYNWLQINSFQWAENIENILNQAHFIYLIGHSHFNHAKIVQNHPLPSTKDTSDVTIQYPVTVELIH